MLWIELIAVNMDKIVINFLHGSAVAQTVLGGVVMKILLFQLFCSVCLPQIM